MFLVVQFAFKLLGIETLDQSQAPALDVNASKPSHSKWDITGSRNGSSDPKVTEYAPIELDGASGTIDLKALQTLANVVDADGQRVVFLRIYNPNAADDIVISKGAANGYPINGATGDFTIEPGQTLMKDFAKMGATISSTVKDIDWTNGGASPGQLSLVPGEI